jgi:hypothetical protein
LKESKQRVKERTPWLSFGVLDFVSEEVRKTKLFVM